jgi:hypothetical protein
LGGCLSAEACTRQQQAGDECSEFHYIFLTFVVLTG